MKKSAIVVFVLFVFVFSGCMKAVKSTPPDISVNPVDCIIARNSDVILINPGQEDNVSLVIDVRICQDENTIEISDGVVVKYDEPMEKVFSDMNQPGRAAYFFVMFDGKVSRLVRAGTRPRGEGIPNI